MEAIVLAGGFGTRLRQVVSDLPKPMAPIAGRPFLEIFLSTLASKGFTRVVLSLGYMADKVISHFGNAFAGMELDYEIEDVPLGTGGAVRQALKRCNSDHVFVFNGDTYLDLEVADVEAQWQQHHLPIIVAREIDDVARYGCVKVSNGNVIGFSEKGINGPGLINAGCYVLPVAVLSELPKELTFSLEADYLTIAVQSTQIKVFVTKGQFIDIGVPEDYARAQVELAGLVN